MKVNVGTNNPLKVDAARAAFHTVFPSSLLDVVRVPVQAEVPPQPFEEEVVTGAINRAREALGAGDFGVGIEAGLLKLPGSDRYLNIQVCAIIDHAGKLSLGSGPGFELPPSVVNKLVHGTTLNHEMENISGITKIKEKEGAIGYLSAGRTGRFAITYTAVLMALIPYIRRELFSD